MSNDSHRRQIQKALDIAYSAHNDEWRKGSGLPYITHIFDVMKLANRIGIPTTDVETYQAIILHDAVESGYARDVIAYELPSVASIVEELTFLGTPEEKHAYLASFATKSLTALVVKVLDRICNVRDFHEGGEEAYARKYLRKADALFAAMMSRRGEIADRWGLPVPARLVDAYARLKNTV